MPAKVPESTAAEALENRPDGKQKPGALVRLDAWGQRARQFGQWLAAAALLLGGMRAVANHFFPGGSESSEDKEREHPRASPSYAEPVYGAWWRGPTGESYADTHYSGPGTNPLSAVSSVIPVDRGIQFSGGALIMNSGLPNGSSTSREPYEALGLRTSSFTKSGGGSNLASLSPTGSVLSFSLSGDVSQVQADPFAVSVKLSAPIAAPEPSAGAMLGVGLVGLALKRRRASSARVS